MKKEQDQNRGKGVSDLKVIVNGTVDLSLMPSEELEFLATRLEKIIFEEVEAEKLKKRRESRL